MMGLVDSFGMNTSMFPSQLQMAGFRGIKITKITWQGICLNLIRNMATYLTWSFHMLSVLSSNMSQLSHTKARLIGLG